MKESEVSKVFNNNEFAYYSIIVDRPLRLKVCPDRVVPDNVFKNDKEKNEYNEKIKSLDKNIDLYDYSDFANKSKINKTLLKKVRPYITEKDKNAKPIDEADLRKLIVL